MALDPIRIVIQSAVDSSVASDIARVSGAVERIGDSSAEATGAVENLDAALGSAGDNDGLNSVASSARDATDGINAAANSADALKGKLEGARDQGMKLAAIGGVGVALLGTFANISAGAQDAEMRLDSILQAQNRMGEKTAILETVQRVTVEGGFDPEQAKELSLAAARMASAEIPLDHIKKMLDLVGRGARSTGEEISSLSDVLREGYQNKDMGALQDFNIETKEMQQNSVDAARAISETAGATQFLDFAMEEANKKFGDLKSNTSDLTSASSRLERAGTDAMVNIGAGAAVAQASTLNLTASVLELVNASPELESAAGYLGYFVSGGAAAVGGLMTVGSQIGLTILSLQSMGITSVASFGAMASAAWASFTTMAAGALTAAPAIWAAMAPLLPLILAIAAAALVTVGALYLLSGAKAAQDQAASDEAQAGEADKEFFEKQTARRKAGKTSHVKAGESFADWQKRMGRGDEFSEDAAADNDPSAAIAHLTKQAASISPTGGGAPVAPVMPSPPAMAAPVVAPPVAPTRAALVAPVMPIAPVMPVMPVMAPRQAPRPPAPGAAQSVGNFAGGGILPTLMAAAGGALNGGMDGLARAIAPGNFSEIAYPKTGDSRMGATAPSGARKVEFDVEAESYKQNARGDIEVTLKGGVITIPNQGIGTLRGRGGRR